MKRTIFLSLILALSVLFLVNCSPAIPATQPAAPTEIPTNPPAQVPPTATEPPAPTETTIAPSEPTATVESDTPGFDGQAILEKSCTGCHSLDRVVNKKASVSEWESTVNRMVSKGAILTADEQAFLIQYLGENYK